MAHQVHFTTGETLEIPSELVNDIVQGILKKEELFIATGLIIKLPYILYLSEVRGSSNATSGVVTRPSPKELRSHAEEERQKTISDPKALVSDIRNNSNG